MLRKPTVHYHTNIAKIIVYPGILLIEDEYNERTSPKNVKKKFFFFAAVYFFFNIVCCHIHTQASWLPSANIPGGYLLVII